MGTLNGEWLFRIDSLNRGVMEQWYAPATDRSKWDRHELPAYWDRYHLEGYDGVGWYARTVLLEDSTKPLVVFFGGVDDDADIWLDGEKIGSHVGYSEPFYVEIPPHLKPGKKELVVRVHDNSGPGGIYKPVTIIPRDQVLEMYKTKYSEVNARPSEDWVRDAVVYEVYLRSFSHQGSSRALQQRLPELKELGVTVVWLMPIHPVGELNRKGTLGSPYAVQDYYAINPEFGTLGDFKALVNAVHAQGMKIIIDLVANHTAWDSRLLMEHPEWFTKNDEGAIVSPNPDWSDVADLNYDQHELRKYMIEMMKYWVGEVGIDGYRCDVAEMVPTDFWNHARFELDKIKPVMMLSEGSLPEHHVEAFDVTYSWTIYDVLSKIIDGSTSVKVFDDIVKMEGYQFPKGALRLRFNTNHDKNAWESPAVTKFSPKGAKTTAVLTFTFPGVPLIYNGEEAGNDKKLGLFEKVEIDWSKNVEFRAFYQVLTQLRAAHVALRRGEYVPVANSSGGKVFSFVRRFGEDQVLVVLNLSHEQRACQLEIPMFANTEFLEYFTRTADSSSHGELSLEMKGLDYKVFLPKIAARSGKQ
jgi:glycosidase